MIEWWWLLILLSACLVGGFLFMAWAMKDVVPR